MSNEKTAVLVTKDVSHDSRIEKDHIIVVGAESGQEGLEASVRDGVAALNNPGVDEALERAEEKYDPSEYDSSTVIARVEPDGTTEWPLEDD